MFLDLALIGAATLGALAGWSRGFILPVVSLGVAFFGMSTLYGGPLSGVVPTGTGGIALGLGLASLAGGFVFRIGSGIVGLVHKVPFLRAGDHMLGLPLGVATGLVGAYVALATVVSVDGLLAPLHGKPSIDAAVIAVIRESVSSRPELRMIADPAMLDQMAAQIAESAIPRDQLAKYNETLAYYEDTVRPQLLSSTLGPLMIRFGELLPVVGRPLSYPSR
jgi:hypothetical protein